MGLLSSIFGGKKTSQPNTAAAEAEARRQAELEAQRYRDQLVLIQAEQERQRAEAEKRYAEQQAAQQAENERQRRFQEDLVNRQIAAREAESARQEAMQREVEARREAERQETMAAQTAKATRAREYADGRQKLMDKGRAEIDAAYSGFDDKFFGDFASQFRDQFLPQVNRGYREARRGATAEFADRNNLRSSAAARAFGDLGRARGENEGKVAGAASDAAQTFRNDIDRQRSDALSLVYSAGGVGSEDLPDGVTDVGGALESLGQRLGSLTTTAKNRAQAVRAPSITGTNLNLNFNARTPGRIPA